MCELEFSDEQRHIVAYLNGLCPDGHLRWTKINALPAPCSWGQVQSASGEELSALMPGVLDKAFRVNCDPLPVLPPNQRADLGEGEWKVGMKRETEKSIDDLRCIIAYMHGLQAKVNALRELQSASGEERPAMMPCALDIAFKGEL